MLERSQGSRTTSTPTDVADAYDRWARQYDDDQNATRDLDAFVLRQVPLPLAGARVLELGCGTGKNSAWLVSQARELIALDFSPGMLDVARRRVRSSTARFIEHDITRSWPADTGSVDVVVGNLVLEHVRDLAPVFAEAARVLRAGGQLYFCELHPYRQLRGGQAHFVDQRTDETIHVAAYRHTVSEYVTEALAGGFVLRALGEWLEPAADPGVPPRLLSLLLER
ncbi:MAG TPA: class I SAM-dependent methyltransferase [Gemmatimonadaceae bacterium]